MEIHPAGNFDEAAYLSCACLVFLWQALSGLPYLTPQSNIDLLWHSRSHMQLQQGIALLMRW